MLEDRQPVRFYKRSDVNRVAATAPAALSGESSRNPVLMARHSAGFSAAMALVMLGRMQIFDKAGSDVDAFSAVMVLLFWALFWSVLFAAGLAWAGVRRLPSFWWAFAAGALTSLGFYLAKALLSYLYGVEAAAAGAGPRSSMAAWMAGYSLVVPVLTGMISARLWRWRTRGSAEQAAPEN